MREETKVWVIEGDAGLQWIGMATDAADAVRQLADDVGSDPESIEWSDTTYGAEPDAGELRVYCPDDEPLSDDGCEWAQEMRRDDAGLLSLYGQPEWLELVAESLAEGMHPTRATALMGWEPWRSLWSVVDEHGDTRRYARIRPIEL